MSQRRRTGSAQIEQLVMLFLVGTAGVVGFAGLGGAFDHAIGARGGFASPATPVAAVHASTAASVSAQAGLGPVAREALRAAEAATRSDKLAAAATDARALARDAERAAGGDALAAMDTILGRNEFQTARPLFDAGRSGSPISYMQYLGAGFLKRLEALGADGHWIDMGSGDGLAITQFYERFHRRGLLHSPSDVPQTTAVARVEGRTGSLAARYSEFTPMYGRLLEDIAPGELASADVISDVWGPLSYSPRMDHVFQRYASLLKPGGELFATLPLSHTFGRRAGGTIGIHMLLEDWFGGSSGLRLDRAELAAESTVRLQIARTEDALRLPDLEQVQMRAGIPPRRIYELAP